MKFELGFNRENDDDTLEVLGAKPVIEKDYHYHSIELTTFEELDTLLSKVDKLKGTFYSAIISFDPPTIFLDAHS